MVTVVSKIQYTGQEFGGDKSLNNQITGKRIATVPALQAEMVLDRESSPTWILDTAQGAAFSKDLLSIVDETAPANIKFIHVQCHQYVESVSDVAQPIRFNVVINSATSLGAMSQFQLTNCDGFPLTGLIISNINIPTGKKAILSIIIGIKN